MDGRVAISLFRHGMTVENERKAYIGWTDSSLSEDGRKYIQKVKGELTVKKVECVFSSDLKRCVETAEILFPNYPIQLVPELREVHFGDWEGKTYEDLKHLAAYQEWLDLPFDSGPDGGETFSEFENRIKTGFKHIKDHMLASSLHEVAIVTHGGVIRSLLTMLVKSEKSFFDWEITYGNGYRISWDEMEFRREGTCTSLQVEPLMENQHG